MDVRFPSGVGVRGFRSFADEWSLFSPLSRVALVVGPNDSGKSNVLRVLTRHLASIDRVLRSRNGTGEIADLESLDAHSTPSPIGFGIAYPTDHVVEQLVEQFGSSLGAGSADRFVRSLVEIDPLTLGTDSVWFKLEAANIGSEFRAPSETIEAVAALGQAPGWKAMQRAVTGGRETSDRHTSIREALAGIYRSVAPELRNAIDVPAIRSIRPAQQIRDHGGAGLVDALQDMQIPGVGEEHKLDEWEALNDFVREVLDAPDATVEIPHASPEIVIRQEHQRLPLTSHGTGFHEVVILAATATVEHDAIVCIEEPEVHLHPGLQKKLLGYLTSKTSNQYFISTHSASLLDLPDISVHRLSLTGHHTVVETVTSDSAQFQACWELGYRPSDIVQTNCIVWVEGPSDRLFLNHWISRVAPELAEGRHYVTMFYGGRLLSHLGESASNLIPIPMMNRRPAILMDSDKTRLREPINETKRRVRDEFRSAGAFVWVTKGREIENYANADEYKAALDAVHPSIEWTPTDDPYAKITRFERPDGSFFTPDKVKVANRLTTLPMTLEQLDLPERLVSLVDYIKGSQ